MVPDARTGFAQSVNDMVRSLNDMLNPGDAQRLEDQARRNGRPQEERYWRDYRAGLESPDRYRRDYPDRNRGDYRSRDDDRDRRDEGYQGYGSYRSDYRDQRDYRYDQR
jgi:hypothetical protein